MYAITQLQQEYPRMKAILADGHQVLLAVQKEIEEQKEMTGKLRREETELIQKMTQIEANLDDRQEMGEQIYENIPFADQPDEDDDVFAEFD